MIQSPLDMASQEENVGSTENSVDIGEKIELRLKPQHPTFSFPDVEEDKQCGSKQHSGFDVYTEKTLSKEEIQKERLREEKIAQEEREKELKEAEEDMEQEEANGDVEGSKEEVRRNSTEEVKKSKPDPVSSINAKDFLKNIHKMKSLSEIDGTMSMSILSTLVAELIWLTEMLDKGAINDRDITENIFGDKVFDCVLDHFHGDSIQDDGAADEESKKESQDSVTGEKPRVHEKKNAKYFVDNVLEEILSQKLKHIDKKKLELISKSQEELGISFRKSSKILSNFELNSKPSLAAKDLHDYVNDRIGRYEKCSTDSSTLTWIANKFYLKSAPKMELDSYIDRINSHLEISGAVGLCAGWYLFKFLFNLKCDEKLSDGIDNYEILNSTGGNTEWESRCLPLILGKSFCLHDDEQKEASDGELKVDGESNTGSNSEIGAQLMDSSFSSCSSMINEDDSYTSATTNNLDQQEPNLEVRMSKISKLNAFRLILTCVRISSKLIEDKNFKQHYYCKVTGLQKLEDLFRLELALGYGLDWELFINEYTLWRYLFHMKALVVGCERLRGRLFEN